MGKLIHLVAREQMVRRGRVQNPTVSLKDRRPRSPKDFPFRWMTRKVQTVADTMVFYSERECVLGQEVAVPNSSLRALETVSSANRKIAQAGALLYQVKISRPE